LRGAAFQNFELGLGRVHPANYRKHPAVCEEKSKLAGL
jgi:hypothetical protein